MSTIQITLERIEAITPHPNADRLEIATILGTQTIVPKGQFQVDEQVIFFPPDMIISPAVSEQLGVQKYLKHSHWTDENGLTLKCQCRIAACRLRQVPSYGFIIKRPADLPLRLANDYTDYFGGVKYEPPTELIMQGDALAEPCNFPRYTNIEHYYRFADVIEPGTLVRVTEKLHGTNCRLGHIYVNGAMGFVCGSHRTVKKDCNAEGKRSLYWEPLLSDPKLQTALQDLSDGDRDVIVYGEIFGPGIQDLDYGVPQGKLGFRVFDISINGCYLNWDDLRSHCTCYGLQLVPLIYSGPFDPALVEEWTNGPTTLSAVKSRFKGREGCVITPQTELYHPKLGRVVLKSVSADYLDRKGAKDNA